MIAMSAYEAHRAKYEAWREQITDWQFVHPARLERLFHDDFTSAAATVHCVANQWYEEPKQRGRPQVRLDMRIVKRRIAVAVYKECARLLVRNMFPDARQYVIDTQTSVGPIVFDPKDKIE